ncbi:MAG: YrrS family protein, partial [Solibacillus isronensis]
HIDYEEKLKAIFSVIDLQQENSIVLRVNNNGSAESAIAVVTSMDKEQKYRVSIEWVDNEGWKPVQVEVLTTLEGSQ